MNWSLNEVEALAKKAARGAGMGWGLAEETGKATRLLLEGGVPVVDLLADLLAENDGAAYASIAPQDTHGTWTARGGVLCPIAAGACLSDHAVMLSKGPITLGPVAAPVFLLPFAQGAARQLGRTINVTWDGVQAEVAGDASTITGVLTQSETARVVCTLSDALPAPTDRLTRADISPAIAARLTALAHRTYAPATEESRLAGAGAGLSDND